MAKLEENTTGTITRNIVKYAPVNRDNGERVATNGYYTGHKKGTPTQAKDENIGKYDVEEGIVRYGTMMGDAAVGAMPKRGVGLKLNLTNCKANVNDAVVSKEDNLAITFTATNGKTLPDAVTVKIGGATKTVTTDYTWTKASGALAIAKAKLTGDVEITVAAT